MGGRPSQMYGRTRWLQEEEEQEQEQELEQEQKQAQEKEKEQEQQKQKQEQEKEPEQRREQHLQQNQIAVRMKPVCMSTEPFCILATRYIFLRCGIMRWRLWSADRRETRKYSHREEERRPILHIRVARRAAGRRVAGNEEEVEQVEEEE